MRHRVAGDAEDAVASAVVAEGRAGVVALPAVELDDLGGVGPVAVHPIPLGAEEDPVVEAGEGQVVPAAEGREAFLELGPLAAGRFFPEALQGEPDLPGPAFSRIALEQLGK